MSRAARDALLWIVLAGGALRFGTVATQGFWLDEQVTLDLIRLDPVNLLRGVGTGESNPALYYVLAGGWERVFGSSELGVRSLSALLGTATIPFVYGAGRALGDRRAGLIAAALAASSPVLIWYSQEARSYALYVFLAAVAFWCFARTLEGRSANWTWGWALSSALALCAHYFAVFLIVPQAAWLLWRRPRPRLEIALAGVSIAIVAIALLPLIATQRGRGEWIADYDLGGRLLQIPEHFLVGLQAPWPALAPAVLVAVIAAGALAAALASPGERRRAAPAAAVLLGALALLLVLAGAGDDYILSRNLLALWIPFALALALVLAGKRAATLGAAVTVTLCVLGVGLTAWIAATPEAQRPDYEELARALGPVDEERLLVSQTTFSSPLVGYLPGSRYATEPELRTDRLVVIEPRRTRSYAVGTCWWIHTCGGVDLSPPPRFEAPRGFSRIDQGSTRLFDYTLYEAPRPLAVERPLEYFTPRVFAQEPTPRP